MQTFAFTPPSLTIAPSGSNLLTAADLSYLGAFKMPGGTFGESQFASGGSGISYNPANNSLFIVGHDWQPTAVAEVSIPTPVNAPFGSLPVATVLQNFVEVRPRLPNQSLNPSETPKVGGTMMFNGDLIGTMYEYYDGSGNAVDSHFRISGANLSSGTYTGLFQVGTMGGGWVGGWMCRVPGPWQGPFGAEYLTGNGALSIIGRTSHGPAAFGFNPAQLGASPAPVVPLLYYDSAHPLRNFSQTSDVFNASTEFKGIAFPEGTDSILFFGRQGTGELYYGTGTSNIALHGTPVGDGSTYYYDPADSSKGYHAFPYRYQMWAYDANDLAAVKAGTMQPWEVQPYAWWEQVLPDATNHARTGGLAYDPAANRLYLSQRYVNGDKPVIRVYQLP
jgi:hypothetical protein